MNLLIKGAIEVAHQLPNYEGACANLHGHRFEYIITFTGKKMPNGMVEDFKCLDKYAKTIIGAYDHKYLNDFMVNPTLEEFAEKILGDINSAYLSDKGKKTNGKFTKLQIWETAKYGVEVEC